MEFTELTLSDFYNMEIAVREDETVSVIIDYVDGKYVCLAGFNADKNDSDIQIKEAAFLHYQKIIEKLTDYGS